MENTGMKEINGKDTSMKLNNQRTRENLKGQKIGMLTLEYVVAVNQYTTWHCRCECGNEKDIYQHNITSGRIVSCGCERKRLAKKCGEENLHIYKGIQVEKAAAKVTQKNNTSGFRGVSQIKSSGKWRSRIILQGVRYELGIFCDFEDAVKARVRAEEKQDAILEEYRQLCAMEG